MEHIAAILLLVGCSDDMLMCRELQAPVPVYETVAECEAGLETQMIRFSSSYPQIVGQCVNDDPALEESDAELVWSIAADGTFLASFEEPVVQVASR